MRLKQGISITLLLTMVVMTACSGAGGAGGSSDATATSAGSVAEDAQIAAIRERGTLRVGMTTTNIPFGFIDRDGEQIGFDVDFATKIADKLGVTLSVDTYKYPGLLPALTTDKIDLVAAGMTITDERKKIVDFSDPYFTEGKVMIVSSEKHPEGTVEDYTAFNDPAYEIAVVVGSTDETTAMKYLPVAQLDRYDSYVNTGLEVLAGRVDGMMANSVFARIYVAQHKGDVYCLCDLINNESYGVAVNKGNAGLLAVVNDVIKEMEADGTYDQLNKEWFEDMDWMSRVDMTR